nr:MULTISPECIES: CmcJ/NvfI family oxidoreductase [unclassified Sphingomonas]
MPARTRSALAWQTCPSGAYRERRIDVVTAAVRYLSPACAENRHYFGPGFDYMTGVYEAEEVVMHDGRGAGLALDSAGVELMDCPTAVADLGGFAAAVDSNNLWNGEELANAPYFREVCELVRERTSADMVLGLNCIMRSSRNDPGAAQRVARQAHVDFSYAEAGRLALAVLAMHGMTGHAFSRFLITSFWRTLTSPPHSVPLAICDASTVAEDDAVSDYMIFCERPPDRFGNAEELPAAGVCEATLFHANRAHRWYWFPDLLPSEALLFKLCDSDRQSAWRAPHTAVQNPLVDASVIRESIECRTIAYFA